MGTNPAPTPPPIPNPTDPGHPHPGGPTQPPPTPATEPKRFYDGWRGSFARLGMCV